LDRCDHSWRYRGLDCGAGDRLQHGLIANIILGIVGAVVLNAILAALGVVPSTGWIAQLIIGIIGAVILIYGWRMIRGRSM
jgi:uncharacterized membrane protein YeaQ/YmgE (transglycosylase-associated protein family)